MNLRNKIAEIFDTNIEKDEPLEKVFERMDEKGRLDIKKIQRIVIAIVEHLENK